MQTQPEHPFDPSFLNPDVSSDVSMDQNEIDVPPIAGKSDVSPAPVATPPGSVGFPLVSDPDPRLVAFHDKRSPATEQYRSLRTNLLALDGGDHPRVLSVTSATKGEGKTVTTLNFAAVLAETPKARVLVVDCDLRNPSIHRTLGQEPMPGLMELLKGEISIASAVQTTPLAGVDVIHSGNIEVAPLELFAAHSLRDLLSALQAVYDFVLIDTPPVFTLTDAAVVGPQTDGALFVVRKHGPPKEVVTRAIEALKSSRTRVLGCVMTGVKPDKKYGRYRYAEEE